MKKIIALCVLLLSLPVLFAQESEQTENVVSESKNEIQFDIGMFPFIESIIGEINGLFKSSSADIPLPTINIQYLRYLDSHNALGGTFSFGVPKIRVTEDENFCSLYGAIMAKYRGIYMDKKNIKLYGDIGLGFELFYFANNEKFSPSFAANIVPLGIWFGSNKFFGTAELSLGTEGSIATLGCGFRF